MRKFRTLTGLALLATLFFASCEQVIEIDLPEQSPQLVVNCSFSPDSTWTARVTNSTSIQDLVGPQPVTNALLLIKENGLTIDSLVHDSADRYVSVLGTMPQAGHSYTVEASATGFQTVFGTDHVPDAVQPYDVAWRDSAHYNRYEGYFGEISFKIDDPAGEENFYVLNFYALDTLFEGNDTIIYPFPFSAETQDPIFEFDFYNTSIIFNDETFDGTTRTLKAYIWNETHNIFAGRTFLRISTVSRAYYRYTQSLTAYFIASWNPFAEPVRVFSNMTPDMGIFAGYAPVYRAVP